MTRFIEIIVIFTYLYAAYRYWGYSVGRRSKLLAGYLSAALAVSGHGLLLYWVIDNQNEHNLSMVNMISQAIWFATAAAWLFSWLRWLAPLTLASCLLGATNVGMLGVLPQQAEYTSYTLPVLFHVLLSLIIVSVFILGVLQALLISIQNYLMKSRPRMLLTYNLPSLEQMEYFLFQLVIAGFIGLTLLIGFSLGLVPTAPEYNGAIKQVLVYMSWFVFASLIIGRHWLGWRGQVAVRWTWSGFGFIVAALILASMQGAL